MPEEKQELTIVAAKPITYDWQQYLPKQPKETTVTQEELRKAEQLILDREHKFNVSKYRHYREQGKVLHDVWIKMAPAEFTRWAEHKLGVDVSGVRRTIALYRKTEMVVGTKTEKLLEAAPGLNESKLTVLLNQSELDLEYLLGAEAEDKRGATVPLTRLPVDQLKVELKRLARQVKVEGDVSSALMKIEEAKKTGSAGLQPPALTQPPADPGKLVIEAPASPGPGEIPAPTPPSPVVPIEVAPPFSPIPFILGQRGTLKTLTGELDDWKSYKDEKFANMATLNAKQLEIVKNYIRTLELVIKRLQDEAGDLKKLEQEQKGN